MPLRKISFQTNITVGTALKFAEGKLCDSQFGPPAIGEQPNGTFVVPRLPAVAPVECQSCGEYCSQLFPARWDARLLVGPCCAEPLQIANELRKGESLWKN